MPVIATDDDKVKVFRFAMYDIGSDAFVESKRWATQKFITDFHARALGDGVEVDSSEVNVNGLTEVGFNPLPTPGGFQREVRSSMRK